ncbi:hypothetical protein D1007_01630 [Hordeum vulgare]|nr:hypothetical protein D1007_01630 [Hordeum vulgare]
MGGSYSMRARGLLSGPWDREYPGPSACDLGCDTVGQAWLGTSASPIRRTLERAHASRGEDLKIVAKGLGRASVVSCELWQVYWPSSIAFKPELSDKYDDNVSLSKFLGIYTIAAQAARRRDEKVLINYFPSELKPNPIDLHVIPKRDNGTLNKYIQRLTHVHHNIPDIHPTVAIAVFHMNVHNRQMCEEMSINKVQDVAKIYALADRYARAEEGRSLPGEDAGVEVD